MRPWQRYRRDRDDLAEDGVRQADAFVDRLDAKLRQLAQQPLFGRSRDELAPGPRSLPFGRHVIFYEPNDGGIPIVRVPHSARDIDALFRDSPPEN